MRSLVVVMLLLLLLSIGTFVAGGAKLGVDANRTPLQLLFHTISLLSLTVSGIFLAAICWLKITIDNGKKEKDAELKRHLDAIEKEWDHDFGHHSGLRRR